MLAYPSLFESSAKPIDFWQAHSNGDLLEILVTESARRVTGFSEGDESSSNDPVPYLDRAKTIANGMINGLELLVPGDRLVWIPARERAELQQSVVFEAKDYCQVVSRTWSPRFETGGWPLVLNAPTYKDMWPKAIKSVRDALALPMPRRWAPRIHRDPSWEPIGSAPSPPEYWLPQLKPRVRKRR